MPRAVRLISIFMLLWAMLAPGCLVMDNAYTGMPPGAWRGVLQIEPAFISPNPKGKPLPEKLGMEYEDVSKGELPFLFSVTYPRPDSFYIVLSLGASSLVLSDYTVGRDYATAKDTLTVRFPGTANYLRGVFEEKILEGHWFYQDAQGQMQSIPLVARQGQDYLFTTLKKAPAADLSGAWHLKVGMELDEVPSPAMLQLVQRENYLSGILEWQGKRYEYLQGTVQAQKLYLASFDGKDAILIEGKMGDNGQIAGILRINNTVKTLWQADKNQQNNQ